MRINKINSQHFMPLSVEATRYMTAAVAVRGKSLPPRGQSHPQIAANMSPRFDRFLAQKEAAFHYLKISLLEALNQAGNRSKTPEANQLENRFLNECPVWESARKIWPALSAALRTLDLAPEALEAINLEMMKNIFRFFRFHEELGQTEIFELISKYQINWSQLYSLLNGGATFQDALFTLKVIDRYFQANPGRQRVIIAPNLSFGLVFPPFAYFSDGFKSEKGISVSPGSWNDLTIQKNTKLNVIYTHSPSQGGNRDYPEGASLFDLLLSNNLDVISIDHSMALFSLGQKNLVEYFWWYRFYNGRLEPSAFKDHWHCSTQFGANEGSWVLPPDFNKGPKNSPRLFLVNANRSSYGHLDNRYHLLYEEFGAPVLLNGGRELENSARLFMCALAQKVEDAYQAAA